LDPRGNFLGYFGVSPWSADGNRYRSAAAGTADDRHLRIIGATVRRECWAHSTELSAQGSTTRVAAAEQRSRAIVFNDCRERRLCCRIVSADGHERSFDWPIQAVHPHGTHALSLNYLRLGRVQPEYGYDVVADNFSAELPVDQDGLWRVDLQSGASVARLAAGSRGARPAS
jgi:hypothetical protein